MNNSLGQKLGAKINKYLATVLSPGSSLVSLAWKTFKSILDVRSLYLLQYWIFCTTGDDPSFGSGSKRTIGTGTSALVIKDISLLCTKSFILHSIYWVILILSSILERLVWKKLAYPTDPSLKQNDSYSMLLRSYRITSVKFSSQGSSAWKLIILMFSLKDLIHFLTRM